MSYLDWKVGDRVVCVDGREATPNVAAVEQGRIYTIRGFFCRYGTSGDVGVRLAEVINNSVITLDGTYEECGYDARRFRKVQPRKTDISDFKAMLHHAPSNAERENA